MNEKEQLQSCRSFYRQISKLYEYLEENAHDFTNDLLVTPYRILRHIVTHNALTRTPSQKVLGTTFNGHFFATVRGMGHAPYFNLMALLGKERVNLCLLYPKISFKPYRDTSHTYTLLIMNEDGIPTLEPDSVSGIQPYNVKKSKFVINAFLTYLYAYKAYLKFIVKKHTDHATKYQHRINRDDEGQKHIENGPHSFEKIFGQNLDDYLNDDE